MFAVVLLYALLLCIFTIGASDTTLTTITGAPSGHQYLYIPKGLAMNRRHADQACRHLGLHLASIPSIEDLLWVGGHIREEAWIGSFRGQFVGECVAAFRGGGIAVPRGECDRIEQSDQKTVQQTPQKDIRLVGKRSADHTIGLYLHHRQVYESEREHRLSPLHAVIHTNNQVTVRVGVLAKLTTNSGLGGSSAVIVPGVAWMASVMLSELRDHTDGDGSVMARDPKQQANLPPNGYTAIIVNLPAGCPPTITIQSTSVLLKWYVFVEDVTLRSRVFVSVERQYIADPMQAMTVNGSAGQARRGGLHLTGRLNSSCYRCSIGGDSLTATVTLTNQDKTTKPRVSGFRLTVKQLLTINVTDQRNSQRTVTKTLKRCIARRDIKPTADIFGTHSLDITLTRPDSDVFVSASEHTLAPSFANLSLPVGSNGKRLTCSLQYYVNIHAVLPWSANLILSLPFTMLMDEPIQPQEDIPTVPDCERVATEIDDKMLMMSMSPVDDLQPMAFHEDITVALTDMDAMERRKASKTPTMVPTRADPLDTLAVFRANAVSVMLADMDPLSLAAGNGRGSVGARRLVRLAQTRPGGTRGKAWDAVRVLLVRCQHMDTLTMLRLDEAVARCRNHLLDSQ